MSKTKRVGIFLSLYSGQDFCGGVALLKNRIRDMREDFDLTQQQLADAIGITQRRHSRIKTGIHPLADELSVRLGLALYTALGLKG